MTREEAVKILKSIKEEYDCPYDIEALEMAIESLKKDIEGRMKYVQETVSTIISICKSDSIHDKCFRNAARFVQNAIDGSDPDFELIPDTEPCEDTISRQAAIEFLKKPFSASFMMEYLENAPSVQPTQKEITEADVKAYCESRNLVVLTKELFDRMNNTDDEIYLYLKDRERR